MKTFLEYVDEAQKKLGLESDAAFAKHLGAGRNLVSQWKNDGSNPEDYYCILIAEILEIDPLEVIGSANHARAKTEERKEFWKNFVKQHVKTVAAVLLGLSIFLGGFSGAATAEKTAAVVAVFCLLLASHNVRFCKDL